MKRTLRIVLLATLWTPLATASSLAQESVAVGLRGGLASANVNSSEFQFGVASVAGLQGGAFLSIITQTRLTMQPEVQFARRGFEAIVVGGQVDVHMDYVDVPLLFKIRLWDETNRLRPSAILGTFIGFEVGCSMSGTLESFGGDSDCDGLVPGRGEFDAGLILGLGADYGLVDRWFLTADVRRNIGLLNISWEGEADSVSSRVWVFNVGIGVFLGR